MAKLKRRQSTNEYGFSEGLQLFDWVEGLEGSSDRYHNFRRRHDLMTPDEADWAMNLLADLAENRIAAVAGSTRWWTLDPVEELLANCSATLGALYRSGALANGVGAAQTLAEALVAADAAPGSATLGRTAGRGQGRLAGSGAGSGSLSFREQVQRCLLEAEDALASFPQGAPSRPRSEVLHNLALARQELLSNGSRRTVRQCLEHVRAAVGSLEGWYDADTWALLVRAEQAIDKALRARGH